jgi:hypothetical protein
MNTFSKWLGSAAILSALGLTVFTSTTPKNVEAQPKTASTKDVAKKRSVDERYGE